MNLRIASCDVFPCEYNAFSLDCCGVVLIQSNVVEDNGNFIHTYRAAGLRMRDNVLRRNGGYWEDKLDPNPGLKRTASKK